MNWNVAIRWIMIVSGVLTSTMLYAAMAPKAAMRSTFGDTLEGPLAEVIVRSWGVLVALMGALLLYGAIAPRARRLALVVVGVSKVAFIGLMFTYGRQYLATARLAVGIDGVMVVLFLIYLLTTRGPAEGVAASAA